MCDQSWRGRKDYTGKGLACEKYDAEDVAGRLTDKLIVE